MSAESELVVTATSETLASEQPAGAERESGTGSAVAPDERSLVRKSKTKGDRTHFSISDGDIGYVDVHSIMRDRNPYSIVDLLQTHGELTGADDSLEITIEEISENEIWGQGVFFRQFIRGQPTREVGTVFFSPDGTVTWMRGDLISTRSLEPGNILILQPEAEAIALEVAASYAANLEPENPEWSDVPVTLSARSTEMHYDLDSDSNLTALWRVAVGISGPVGTGVYVSISPQTGEVLRVDSALVRYTTTGHAFIVCDGALAATEDGTWPTKKIGKGVEKCDTDNSAGSPLLISVNGKCKLVSASICTDSVYTTPQATVDGVFAAVQAVSSRSIASPINIIVRYPGTGFSGDWNEETSTIRITAANTDPYYTAVHEAFHAVSQSPVGQIEHGLVYGMSAIHTGRAGDWHYEGASIASEDAITLPTVRQ